MLEDQVPRGGSTSQCAVTCCLQVDFVKDAISSAEVNYLEEPDEESVKERRHRSMMEERMSLPIYPYRQQLLDAIAEEQVR